MKKKNIIISLCLVLVAVFSIFLYKQSTDTVGVRIEKTNKFTENEIKEAINTVKEQFENFKGCELTDVWYSEKKSNSLIEDYMKYGKGSENGVSTKNVIVLLSNFEVDSSGGDGSFEPNSTQSNWSWTLIRDSKTGNWQVDDSGY